MNIITLFGYGLNISLRKYPVHGYFTRDKLGDVFNTELRINFCGKRFEHLWTPKYKIVITWEHDRIEQYDLHILKTLLESMNIKHDFDYKNRTLIFIVKNMDDGKRNAITMAIKRIGYFVDDEFTDDNNRETHFKFNEETFMLDRGLERPVKNESIEPKQQMVKKN